MNIANKISIFRILTVPFFIASLVYYTLAREFLRHVAFVIFIFGVVSDAVDGYIARKSKQHSKAGLILDPLGDKLLLMSAFICLSWDKFGLNFPLWVTMIVISRDVLILLGATVIYMVKQNIGVLPTKWGKLTTTFQMITVISVLVKWKISPFFWSVAVFFTLLSGIDYIRKGFKILYGTNNH